MAALASIDDYRALTGRDTVGADAVRIARLIEIASDAVLASAHGQQIVAGTSTVTIAPWQGVLWLPQRPATAITSVIVDGVELDPSTYQLDSGGDGRPASIRRLVDGLPQPWTCTLATVTYTHGWPEIPGQLVAIVCAMVRAVDDQGGGPPAVSETVGPFSRSFDATDLQAPDMALTATAAATINRLCSVRGYWASIPIGT